MSKVRKKIMLYRDKSRNRMLAEDVLNLEGQRMSDEDWEKFKYLLSEVKCEVEIDTETGEYEILKVMGRELKKPRLKEGSRVKILSSYSKGDTGIVVDVFENATKYKYGVRTDSDGRKYKFKRKELKKI